MYSARQNARDILLVILGASILAFGSYNLNYQNDVTEGGVLGLILLLQKLYAISPSITSVIVDFSLFLVGMRFLGKKFLFLSFLSTATFSITYRMWESIGFIVPNLQNNMILAGILSGVAVGLGVGLVVRVGAASGGDDVLAILGSKFSRLKIHHMYYLMDAVVLTLSLTYISIDRIVYSIIAVLVSGTLISVIHDLGKKKEKVAVKGAVVAS
ncbi:YitT family protein [Clostridium thermobutyricum]|uniref:YitT family protein n=1 Tax=Clostridium thermobutyricum TaxID=29372 RepID=UPI002942D98B|nr:YitT family protein [Clostridium thermobutyricum]